MNRGPEKTPEPRSRRAPWLAIALCAFGVIASYWPTWRSGFCRMQAEPGDSLHLNYVVEHQYRQIRREGAVGTYWSPGSLYPTRDGLAYSENLMGTLPFYVAPRLFTDARSAFQIWGMLLLIANYCAMFSSLDRFGVRPWLAAVGAFVFAFSLTRIAHLNHQHHLPHFAAPIALWAATAWLQKPRIGLWVALWAAMVMQWYLAVQLAWFLWLSLAVCFVVAVALDRQSVRRVVGWLRGSWIPALATVTVSAVLLSLLLAPYLRSQRAHGARDDVQVTIFAPRLYSWFSAPAGSVPAALGLDSDLSRPFSWEHELFPGSVLLLGLACALVAGVRGHRGTATTLAVTAAALFALSLYLPAANLPNDLPVRARGATLWWLIWDHVPGASGVRAVARVWTAILPLLVLATALTAERVLERSSAWRTRVAIALLAAWGVVEQLRPMEQPSFDKRAVAETVERWRSAIPPTCGVVYFAFPRTGTPWVSQMTALWAALEAGVPTVNGYTSNYPPGYPPIDRAASREEVERWLGPVESQRLCYVTAPAPLGAHPSVNTVTRDDLDLEDSFGNDLDGDGVHDRITVGTQGGITVAGTDDLDNDPKDEELIVLDPNLDPNGSLGFDLDRDGDRDLIQVGKKATTLAGVGDLDNDPREKEVILLYDPNLELHGTVGYDLDGDSDVDIVVVGTTSPSGIVLPGNSAADHGDQKLAILDGRLAPDAKLTIDVDSDGDTDVLYHGASGRRSAPRASCVAEHVLVFHQVVGAETYRAVDSLGAGHDFAVGSDSMLALLTSPGGRVALYPGFRVAVGGSLVVSTDRGACQP